MGAKKGGVDAVDAKMISTVSGVDWADILIKEGSDGVVEQHRVEIANEMFRLKKDKKMLEKRVIQLEENNQST